MNYADQVALWKRWDSCVNFGSPVSAWTPRMLEISIECGSDRVKAMKMLDEENRIGRQKLNTVVS